MSLNTQNIEELFSKEFEAFKVEPDRKVLNNIRFKLWKADFFSLDMRKINIVYASVFVAGFTFLAFLAHNEMPPESKLSTTEKKQVAPVEKTENIQVEKEAKPDIVEENTNKLISPSAFFNASAIEGCAPLKVSFKDASKHARHYNWDFGDGVHSNSIHPVHIYEKPGNYIVELSITGEDNQTYQVNKKIVVNSIPESAFIINPEASSIVDKQVVFENKSTNAVSYKWNFGDRSLTSTEHSPKHKYTNFSSYQVSLIATSAKGCSDTTVNDNNFLERDYSMYFPKSFRPNTSDPINQGVFGNEAKTLALFYPENNGAKEYELKIFMGNGTLAYRTNNIKQGWNGYVNGRLVPDGVYTYQASGIYPNGKSFLFSGDVKVIIDTYEDNY